MKHLIFVIVLLLTPSISFSEWERIGDIENSVYFTDYDKVVVKRQLICPDCYSIENVVYFYLLVNADEPWLSPLTDKYTMSIIHYSKGYCGSSSVAGYKYSEYGHHFGEGLQLNVTLQGLPRKANDIETLLLKKLCK